MTIRSILSRHWRDDRGATAVEFAIIGPLALTLLIGIMGIGLILLSIGSMHFAVEDAARCASAKTTTCPDSAAIIAYANSRYFGALVSPVFTYDGTQPCGNKVTGAVTFNLDLGMWQTSVPLSAVSCFP